MISGFSFLCSQSVRTSRSPPARLVTGAYQGGSGRRRHLDLEYCGRTVSRSYSNRGLLPCLRASHKLSRLMFPGDETARQGWVTSATDLLEKGDIESLVAALRALVIERPELAEKLNTEAEYFERNAAKMRYPDFRAQGLFVGSGGIEAACKTVIGTRLKQSGMFWTAHGANRIIEGSGGAGRCVHGQSCLESADDPRLIGPPARRRGAPCSVLAERAPCRMTQYSCALSPNSPLLNCHSSYTRQ
jgi:hypothetical protein